MCPGDELLVDVNDDAPWGHRARNRMMERACGDALLFMDDDDMYLVEAFRIVRAAFAAAPDGIHLFKIRYPDGRELWVDPIVRQGNVSTQMVCVPNDFSRIGRWGDRYEGDLDFIVGTVANFETSANPLSLVCPRLVAA